MTRPLPTGAFARSRSGSSKPRKRIRTTYGRICSSTCSMQSPCAGPGTSSAATTPTITSRGRAGWRCRSSFPSRTSGVNYDLEDVLPGFFDELKTALAPEDEDQQPFLTMARLPAHSAYSKGQEVQESQLALVGLIRSGLLKRFESSAYAFARTTGTMAAGTNAFLKALDAGYILSPKAMEEWTNVDTDEEWTRMLGEWGSESAESYKVRELACRRGARPRLVAEVLENSRQGHTQERSEAS